MINSTDLKLREWKSSFPPYRPTGKFDLTALTLEGVRLLEEHWPGSPGDWSRIGMVRMVSRRELKALGWM